MFEAILINAFERLTKFIDEIGSDMLCNITSAFSGLKMISYFITGTRNTLSEGTD